MPRKKQKTAGSDEIVSELVALAQRFEENNKREEAVETRRLAHWFDLENDQSDRVSQE